MLERPCPLKSLFQRLKMIKTLWTAVAMLLLAVLILSQHSYAFQHSWRPRCLQRILTLSKLAAVVGGDDQSPITSTTSSPTKKAGIENNDDDAEIERQMRLEDELELQADVPAEDGDVDINLVESDLDISISFAIKNMLDEGPKIPELTPVEKFDKLYKVLEWSSLDSSSSLSLPL